ncbi:MAG TPA: hypothetical protein VLX91_10085 [Candidatus Acidoferrales bacterium]|nr:hypothetical protein [Candidatus Acidoferrales bacterium]
MENIKCKQQVSVLMDWRVRISQNLEVIELRPLSLDPSRIRLMPVYLETGEMSIVVPAASKEAAEEKAKNIATQIASVGLWGTEIWDRDGFLASIESVL